MFSYVYTEKDELEEIHELDVVYETNGVRLSFTMDKLRYLFSGIDINKECYVDEYASLQYDNQREAITLEVATAEDSMGGIMTATIDLSNPDTKASLEAVIKKWEELEKYHVSKLF